MQTPELLSDPVFHDEEAARLYLQEVRWPDGVSCPFCGVLDGIRPLGGDSMGPGWFYCEACQDKFTKACGSVDCSKRPGDPSLRAHMRSRCVQDDKGFRATRKFRLF